MVGIMKLNKNDKKIYGVIAGLLAPVIGFLLYGLFYSWEFNTTLAYFVEHVFFGTKSYQSPIISISLIADLGVFFLVLKYQYYKVAKGIVYALLMYAPLVIYLRFF